MSHIPDVITMGESMLRLAALEGEALERSRTLDMTVAGAESNVAVDLSRMGLKAGWISRLVDNPLGRRIAYDLRANGVDISRVLWTSQGRVGLYFLEPGLPPRSARLFYDRAGSAMAAIDPEEVDWDYVRQARLIHLTGITPALSASCEALVRQAIANAKQAGQMISFDVNYRSRLWTAAEARDCLEALLPGIDILLCGRQDAREVFDLPGDPAHVARALAERFAIGVVVVTDQDRGAIAYADGEQHQQAAYPAQIIDPIGAGDAFAAGFLAGYLEADVAQGLAFGNALAALKLTYRGDLSWSLRRDVEALIGRGQGMIDVDR